MHTLNIKNSNILLNIVAYHCHVCMYVCMYVIIGPPRESQEHIQQAGQRQVAKDQQGVLHCYHLNYVFLTISTTITTTTTTTTTTITDHYN